MPPPSPRMIEMAQCIVRATDRDGRPPSRRQLADELGVTLGRLQDLIRESRKRGLVTYRPGEARTLKVDRALLRRRPELRTTT
jgi:DNA-binding transcriptional MocR family regulator